MDAQSGTVDYYEVLQCDRKASTEELKKSYQRLLLLCHPDKITTEGQYKTSDFHLIQKAWDVLRDSTSRKQYDASLSCQEHTEHLLYDSISISDMDFDSVADIYTFSCRCGGVYLLSNKDLSQKNVVVPCDECSFSIQVST